MQIEQEEPEEEEEPAKEPAAEEEEVPPQSLSPEVYSLHPDTADERSPS